MSIFPLPMFERDADPKFRDGLSDEEIYARLKPPTSIVVKFGRMKLIGEYPYRGDAKPGCGSKLVIRTFRAIEIAEMLTTTCSNSGCGKSVSRSEMLNYIENSGGRDYPFQTNGEILRVATVEDLNRAAACTDKARGSLARVRELAADAKFPAKIVDLELTLDESLLLVYYLCDERIDFRELAQTLAREFGCRIEMRQVGARDEARLVADYERCGQHCCCKNFLKVLKPISMRAAKIQKATLDPLKISGRCGRLMCCLRYEDATYEELRKRLPKNKSRVGTAEGPGIVVDTKILVQLVLVRLDPAPGELGYGREIAVPVEELMDPDKCPAPGTVQSSDPLRGMSARSVKEKLAAERSTKLAKQDRFRDASIAKEGEKGEGSRGEGSRGEASRGDGSRGDGARAERRASRGERKGERGEQKPGRGGRPERGAATDGGAAAAPQADGEVASVSGGAAGAAGAAPGVDGEAPTKKKRRRRKKKGGAGAVDANGAPIVGGGAPSSMAPRGGASDDADADGDGDDGESDGDFEGGAESGSEQGGSAAGRGADGGAAGDAPRKKKRRRKRRRGGGANGGGGGGGGGPSDSSTPPA
ncbi:MAG: regulatory iron-sulfur-containing complex subunit RicT [Phycisphaerales bacterium]